MKLRPKHQVLILKCYPKFQKSKLEVHPNSSELSYLLHYASTRRTKLQKVGAFLEQKTAHDVSRSRTGDVQVTLEILRALIDKCFRDLGLFASHLLCILDTILRSKDVTLVEDSVPTFEAFCAHRDSATLSPDESYARLYDKVLSSYLQYASKESPFHKQGSISVPIALRFRMAGLKAIKSVVSSESPSIDSHKQLRVILPVILHNLVSKKPGYFSALQQRGNAIDQFEKDSRRRQSTSIIRSADPPSEADPATSGNPTAELDERADEDSNVLALQCLRQIFAANNRGQLRASTHVILNFVTDGADDKRLAVTEAWYTDLFEMLCKWTPVQDRFIIFFVLIEMVLRSPTIEADLPRQLILTRIVDSLLRSDVIFIGLNVMDVMRGMIQRVLILLQLGGNGIYQAPPQPSLSRTKTELKMDLARENSLSKAVNGGGVEVIKTPSEVRLQLLGTFEACIANLALHIYYADQISDMVSALLLRLKPSSPTVPSAVISAIEDPLQARGNIADSVNLVEKANVDHFFSFDTARALALRGVKQILTVANSKRPDGSNVAARSRAPISVWDGTQWLLRDPEGEVRKAYVDALLTWLHLEMDRTDARLLDAQVKPLQFTRKETPQSLNGKLARRAVSNASQRKVIKQASSYSFLQLLHLAVYDNALQYAESDADILLLHLLVTELVRELGLNSVVCSLPMMFRLQEDVSSIRDRQGKIAVASLVCGYFAAIVDEFDLETTFVGRDLQKELARRANQGLWLEQVRTPALTLSEIGDPINLDALKERNEEDESVVLEPVQSRQSLVDSIAEAYVDMPLSPPSSPPLSPNRRFSISGNSDQGSPALMKRTRQFPERAREKMMTEWTKESCKPPSERDSSKAISLSGSRITHGRNHFLTVDTTPGTAQGTRTPSPKPEYADDRGRPMSTVLGISSGRATMSEIFRHPSHASSPIRVSVSSSPSIIRVKDLKLALSGQYRPTTAPSGRFGNDADSDTLASDDMTTSEPSPTRPVTAANGLPRDRVEQHHHPRPRSSGSSRSPPLRPSTDAADYDIPPVPPLPPSLHIQAETPLSDDIDRQLGASKPKTTPTTATVPPLPSPTTTSQFKQTQSLKNKKSVDSNLSGRQQRRPISSRRNVNELLDGIDSSPQRPGSSVGRPPY